MCVRGHVNTLQVNLSLHEIESKVANSLPQDMMQLKLELQEILLAREEQEEVLRRRERELTALKGALKEEVAAHDQEVDKMREQYEKEIRRLQTSLEEAKQVVSSSSSHHSPPVCLPHSPRSCPPPVQKRTLLQRGVETSTTQGGGGLYNCFASCAICYPSDVWLLQSGDFV